MALLVTQSRPVREGALTECGAAARLGVKPATLRAWRQRGQGPAFVRLGRAIRYLPEDLETFLRANRFATESPSPR